TSAWLEGRVRAALPRVGLAAQLQAVAPGDGRRQRGLALPRRAAEPAPLSRRLAAKPPGVRLLGRLPPLKSPAPESMTVSFFSLAYSIFFCRRNPFRRWALYAASAASSTGMAAAAGSI